MSCLPASHTYLLPSRMFHDGGKDVFIMYITYIYILLVLTTTMARDITPFPQTFFFNTLKIYKYYRIPINN